MFVGSVIIRVFGGDVRRELPQRRPACVSAYNLLIAVLTAITIVLGMWMMGAKADPLSLVDLLLALTSMQIFKSFSVWSFPPASCVGVFLHRTCSSYVYSIPAGKREVVVNPRDVRVYCIVSRSRRPEGAVRKICFLSVAQTVAQICGKLHNEKNLRYRRFPKTKGKRQL